MGKRLFVGNLSYGTTEPTLRALFADHGFSPNDAVIVTDRETGRSRGFGFVELDDEAAKRAMEKMDGFEFEGRNLTVREAYDRAPRRRDPVPEMPPFEVPIDRSAGAERRRPFVGGGEAQAGGGGGGGDKRRGGGRRGSGRGGGRGGGRWDDDDW